MAKKRKAAKAKKRVTKKRATRKRPAAKRTKTRKQKSSILGSLADAVSEAASLRRKLEGRNTFED